MNLERFLVAQEKDYQTALEEVKRGYKSSHWIWYIFPQIEGMGYSETSKFYSIKSVREAIEYYKHPVLGSRLKEITNELLKLDMSDPNKIFGSLDAMKVKSCMTLFYYVSNDELFKKVLDKYYEGTVDKKTIDICIELLKG